MTIGRRAHLLKCDRGQRRQRIIQSLLTDVFEGRLQAGRRLVTQELADQFGVSHTPIREALIGLAGFGFVDLLPNRGAVVRRFTSTDIREIYQVRRVLECKATRDACGRIDRAELRSLEKRFQRLSAATSAADGFEKSRQLDNRLHDLIARCCGNSFLMNEIGRLKLLFRVFRDVSHAHYSSRNDFHRLGEEAREHLEIVRALQKRDRKEAGRAMARHLLSGSRYWRRTLEEASEAIR